jgi:hypothetical protein
MNTRLIMQGKGGMTQRTGGPYDGWWNGGIRNTATFHNTIAMLTEMIGGPTPQRVPLLLPRQIPQADLALPIAPQEWRFRQSVDYSIELDRAVLNYASRNREDLLHNIYRMGRNSIERGSRDTWTANPRRDAAVAEVGGRRAEGGGAGGRGGRGGAANPAADSALWAAMHRPEMRDPRGYIIPASQPDFGTATKFVNALLETGITVSRATAPFTVAGKSYPAGSYVVKTNQAFRPHVMDMFEPQQHPDVIPYPGASPTPPYDIAGWTLAYQMGVDFDRVLDDFSGPFQKITAWNVSAPNNGVASGGFTIDRHATNSFVAVNRLLKAGVAVSEAPNGDFVVPPGAPRRLIDSLGLVLEPTDAPVAGMLPVKTKRIGLWDQYGGSMDAGWARWILEQFEFPFERVFAPALDAGGLDRKYDVLVFVDGAIPGATTGRRGGAAGADSVIADLPAEYRDQVGRVTTERTLPRIREFVEAGGTAIAIGSSATNLAAFLGLPIESQLVENGQPLPRTKFYVPGSLLSARLDAAHPLTAGMPERVDVFFDDSPVFRLGADAGARGVRAFATYDGRTPLRSGWAWGQSYLENGVVAAEARVGKGRVLLFGPEILKRAQPHGTFKFLFNGIYSSLGGR